MICWNINFKEGIYCEEFLDMIYPIHANDTQIAIKTVFDHSDATLQIGLFYIRCKIMFSYTTTNNGTIIFR
jgi:hypothetical protein